MSSLNIDSEEVEDAINSLLKSGFVDYKSIAEIAYINIKRHFFEGQGPVLKWERKKKDGEQSYLQKTGTLLKSIKKNALKTKAQISTDVEYARVHNFGGDTKRAKIPQREFFFFDQSAIKDMMNSMTKIIFKAWRRP